MNDNKRCGVGDCTREARWTWHDGMWPFGRYCDDHMRQKLESESDRSWPAYRDPITTRDNVSRLPSGTVIIPAGAQPVTSSFPTIRSKEAFDSYLQSGRDREGDVVG